MSDVFRQTPYASPDTLRAKLHMDKKFYDAHTKQSVEYQHVTQTHNIGTVENWGAEMLLSTRKLKMNRPPLGDIILSKEFYDYFTLKNDDNIETYAQENAIMCVLKPNTCRDGKEIYVRFENVEKLILPRAFSSSEKLLFPHVVWRTKTPPKLVVNNAGDALNGTFDLVASSKDDKLGDVTYWFETTIPTTNQNVEDYLERNLLDSNYCTDSVIQTIPLELWCEEQPFVWLTFSKLKTLPDCDLPNNIGWNNRPIFTAGSDGHGKHFLYPFLYGNDNYPEERTPENSDWQVRLYSCYVFGMEGAPSSFSENKTQYIKRIQFVHYKNNDPYTPENHLGVINIDLPQDHIRFRMVNNEERYQKSKWGDDRWSYRKAVEGDWDYDGITYVNPVYAYINGFISNNNTSNTSLPAYRQPFLEILPDKTSVNWHSWDMNPIEIGTHVDYTTDFSMNGVKKKNGTVFNLGDFDGLPRYYHQKLPRDTHRSHVELYSMKDNPNVYTQQAMDRRVATVIVDAGVPQNDFPSIEEDMESAITFQSNRTYITDENKILTMNNVKSDIGFSSRIEFGDITMSRYEKASPFIYHGQRNFSLGMLGYDNELEKGRVYYLSNDTIAYDNNAISDLTKPPRTMARIADIPTDTSQLVSIKGKAPTLITDEKYTRTEMSYTKEDREWLYGLLNNGILVKYNGKFVFHEMSLVYQGDITMDMSNDEYQAFENTRSDLDYIFTFEYLVKNGYGKPVYEYDELTMHHGIHTEKEDDYLYRWLITDGGSGYVQGDIVQCYLAGQIFKGVVAETVTGGTVTKIDMLEDVGEDLEVSYQNFDQLETPLSLTLVKKQYSSTGNGLTVTFKIYHDPTTKIIYANDKLLDNLFTLQFDIYGALWIMIPEVIHVPTSATMSENTTIYGTYNPETGLWTKVWSSDAISVRWKKAAQLTGDKIRINGYSYNASDYLKYSINAIMIARLSQKLIQHLGVTDGLIHSVNVSGNTRVTTFYKYDNVDQETFDSFVASEMVSEGYLKQDSYYFMRKGEIITIPIQNEDGETINRYRTRYDLMQYQINDTQTPLDKPILFPRNHKAIVNPGWNKSVSLSFGNGVQYGVDVRTMSTTDVEQTSIFMYDPYATSFQTHQVYYPGITQKTGEHKITFLDFYRTSQDSYLFDVSGKDVVLTCDVWKYNGEEIEYTSDEDVDKQIPYEPNIHHVKQSMIKIRNAGEVFGENYNHEETTCDPIGEQPKGAFLPITARTYDKQYHFDREMNYAQIESDLQFFFKIPDDVTSLTGYHIKETYIKGDHYEPFDLSPYTILLWKKALYIYDAFSDNWIALRRRSV